MEFFFHWTHFLKKTFENICFIIFRFRVSSKNIFWFIVFFKKKKRFFVFKNRFRKTISKKTEFWIWKQIFIKEIFCKQFFSFIKNKFWKQFLYYFENSFENNFFFHFENRFYILKTVLFFFKEKKSFGFSFF